MTTRVAAAAALISCLTMPVAAENFGDSRNLDTAHTKTHFVHRLYPTLAEWTARRTELQKQILSAAGLFPMPPKTPLRGRRESRVDHGQYFTEKVIIEPLPGFLLAGNLYLPKGSTRKAPAVLVPHGHWKHGRVHNEPEYSVPAMGVNLARQGYVAFAYDMVGYNDTRQLKHEFGGNPEEQLWSWGPLGLQLWNAIRAVDFVQSLPEVDPARIAITGASGGGTQTMLAAAVEERIKVSIPVNMVSTTFQGDDACEVAPSLRIHTNNVETAAMMAPRPMMLISSTQDWTKLTPKEEFPTVRAIYQLFGQEKRVASRQIDAPHNYNRASREAAYSFLKEHLWENSYVAIEEVPLDLKPESLLFDGPLSKDPLPDQKQLFAEWKEMARKQIASLSPARRKVVLRQAAAVEWPETWTWILLGEQLLLQRGGSGERIPIRRINGGDKGPAVVVDADGSRAEKLAREGWDVTWAHVYQTGLAETQRPVRHDDYLTFHRSDDANRVQDILTALAASIGTGPIRLECDERSEIWCAAAAAMADRPVEVRIPGSFQGTDADFEKKLFIPGIRRAGGWEVIRSLAAASLSGQIPGGRAPRSSRGPQ